MTTTMSLLDGRILSGTIDNLVVARERDCGDAALKMCGPARPREIKRFIEVTLER